MGWRILSRPEQVKTKRQACGASAVGQEAKVSDAHEALREQIPKLGDRLAAAIDLCH